MFLPNRQDEACHPMPLPITEVLEVWTSDMLPIILQASSITHKQVSIANKTQRRFEAVLH